MSYFDGNRWLDGPALCRWLNSLGRPIPDSLRRRMWEWQRGQLVDLYSIDRHLCAWEIHPSEIPDNCWSDRAPDRGAWARTPA